MLKLWHLYAIESEPVASMVFRYLETGDRYRDSKAG